MTLKKDKHIAYNADQVNSQYLSTHTHTHTHTHAHTHIHTYTDVKLNTLSF